MNNNLTGVLNLLKSEKIKERQEGITSLRTVFLRDSTVLNLDVDGNGKAWLVVFQALFTAVVNEKAACVKKGFTNVTSGPGATALRRLGEAASAVRWLTERSVQRMNKKVLKPLLAHLLQTMVYHGELLSVIALDYAKALRCIVSYTPHLEHLDEDAWLRMVEISFNVILGDPARNRMDGDDEELEGGLEVDDSDHSEDAEADDDAGPSTSTATQSKKRRRPSPKAKPPKKLARGSTKARLSVSLEQVEFTSLLAILLQSPSAPLLSPEYRYLPSAVLTRLQRFLHLYPGDSSLQHDYLRALHATLSHLALNQKDAVQRFARGSWDGLVEMWKMKNKLLKENLLSVLCVLFPFVTASDLSDPERSTSEWADGVGKLWQLLDGEAESRWGVDGLSLDALRLQLVSTDEDDSQPRGFVSSTFRYGWQFDSGQALAWSILQLQADCLQKLYLLSESSHDLTPSIGKSESKRARLDSPMSALLQAIRSDSSSIVRAYRLQVLLFFIDRHWAVVHASLQQDVSSTLSNFIAVDDAVVQSWTFLCFAAIAYADGNSRTFSSTHIHISERSQAHTRDLTTWDQIWTHAIRRTNVAGVCRAACHTAYTLLSQGKQFVPLQRVLTEIESLAKDLDVQGPTFPYDSVCAFLSLCLKVASQDVRLYRMQLEEKVLSWLVDSWRVSEGRGSSRMTKSAMPPHVVSDVLSLFENICCLSKRSHLMCRILLPESLMVQTIREQSDTAVIRDFLLQAQLPKFRGQGGETKTISAPALSVQSSLVSASSQSSLNTQERDLDLTPPRGRERRISAFLLKSLEELCSEWESIRYGKSSVEKTRQWLDFAIAALAFESLLVLNGTRPNRRVIQAACKFVSSISPLLLDARVTTEEKLFLIMGLEPLVMAGLPTGDTTIHDPMLPPDEGTGISREILKALTIDSELQLKDLRTMRRELHRTMWRSADMQDSFSGVIKVLKSVVQAVTEGSLLDTRSPQAMDIDTDGFGSSTRTHHTPLQLDGPLNSDNSHIFQSILASSITFLALAPVLQASSGEPTRDRELCEFLLQCDGDRFVLAGSPYFDNVQNRTLSLTVATVEKFLDKFGTLLDQYAFSRSERLQLMLIHFLDSTSYTWLNHAIINAEVGGQIRNLSHWLSTMLQKGKIRSWKIRDRLAAFLDHYLVQDPSQGVWKPGEDDDAPATADSIVLPSAILPTLGRDEDIRVRFRVALTNCRLFSLIRSLNEDPKDLYMAIRTHLCTDLTNYEHMLTRLLCLGNVMIVSSTVRRGPYWHILETCLHTPAYNPHIDAILNGVSQRMGLPTLSGLFEAYASQIAYSIRQGELDFLRFPPHLLGYKDRRECAEATFRAFSPTNVLAGGTPSIVAHGKKLFANHCKAIQKTVTEGTLACLPDIIGYQIVFWVDDNIDDVNGASGDLENLLKAKTGGSNGDEDLERSLRTHADGIMAAVLRSLGDQDCCQEGSIVQALRATGENDKVVRAFQSMVQYRSVNDFRTHDPNLPAYSAVTILKALKWFISRVPEGERRAMSYHVLHQIFEDIRSSPLVNEQIRLLNSICLWMATQYRHAQDPTLLHTLINGAVGLLTQLDLVHAAQSLLEWAFGVYRKVANKDPRFPDVLIRICCLAHDLSLDFQDTFRSALGRDLFDWLEVQMLEFSKVSSIKSQVVKALPAWPREPPPALTSMYEGISSENLSFTLSDPRISSNRFRLVRRLRDISVGRVYDTGDQFAKSDFWRLKECIPSAEQLQVEDVDAFAALLLWNKGQIHSFAEQPNSQTVRSRHRRNPRKRESTQHGDGYSSPHGPIVLSLLAMLDASVSSPVNTAYRTLRTLMSIPTIDMQDFRSAQAEYRGQLEYLRTYPLAPQSRPRKDIGQILGSEDIQPPTAEFGTWITVVTIFLADILAAEDGFYAQLSSILASDIDFAEQILPVLVHTILYTERLRGGSPQTLASRSILSQFFTSVLTTDQASTSSLRAVVDVVLHLRNFRPPDIEDALAYDHWLQVDYTLLSRSSIQCGAYTTALLFLELAAQYQPRDIDKDDSMQEDILFAIYSHIDEPDGFYGIKTGDLRQFLIKRFHHEKQWEKAFRFHGAALEADASDPNEARGIIQSLHSFGFDHLAITTLHGAFGEIGVPGKSSSMSYQCGWRTETWDLPDQTEYLSDHASLYRALRAIYRERDQQVVDATIRRGLLDEMNKLNILGHENLVEIRQVAQTLMCLSQVSQWRSSLHQQSLQSKTIDHDRWSFIYSLEPDFDFQDLETIMATRISLVRSARQKEQREQMGVLVAPFTQDLTDIEKKCLVRLSHAARDSRHLQVALNSIVRAQKLEQQPSFEVTQEFASVLWLQQEQKLAVALLKSLVDSRKERGHGQTDRIEQAMLLSRLGTWTAEACLEKPTDILTHYFDPAAALIRDQEGPASDDSRSAIVYHQCAMFAERQYHAILKSPDAVRWKVYMDRKKQEIRHRVDQLAKTQSGTTTFNFLTQEQKKAAALLKLDEEQWKKHNGARDAFLEQAIDMYSRCLHVSDAFDDDGPIRLCSLWFANFEAVSLQPKVRLALDRIPSRKFVFLAHQLSARLSRSHGSSIPKNQDNLHSLITRMCREHPFHSIYQVYCLRPDSSSIPNNTTRRQSSRHDPPSSQSQAERGAAASDILDRLRGDSSVAKRLGAIEALCDASLEWAKFPIKKDPRFDKKQKSPYQVPDTLAIYKLRDVQVPIITIRTPVDPTMRYDHCVCISRYEPTFDTAGGVNLPKIINCIGTDGEKYKQLFKGEGGDDLRQDAVMEQVFDLVNMVLQRDLETRKRNLSIRGYKVVPLAPQAGVIEFVGNTTPLQSWLFKAHVKYRPDDLKHADVYSQLTKKRTECQGEAEPLLYLYLDIRKRFKPVMRHYFTERHKTPLSWFVMRLKYTRSVATTSIVGHVLGLGDRHTSNILMDNNTGEVVHIDLGIAFDQGKLLPVPERVPFRMTADMVDGMGTAGTQGVFQRCAEETLRVLRVGSEVIMTVLEVFKYDPLHSWTASEFKVKRVQGEAAHLDTTGIPRIGIDMSSGSADEAADRALSSVSRKLDKSLSVEYTVNELIAEATDPANLATIFIGWGPHY
ncbi:hypothetical protein JAAARDRAFT_509432 [Jaapia argillacea MUCL 33604]|uniref:Serine/threonine-protein kinase Tel1 n=1 Tax=Jaapia argillacea MUCL 33604 TaxID=933084 RepID=A0A067Q5J4_9AGAM|nr:hypothetical protein JAAARDRAFT_509432 [Jaapia argillacea MUCL 33604]